MLGFSVDGLKDALGGGYLSLVYGVGVLAMLLSVAAFQFKRRVTIILCNFFGQTCWVVYFLLQGDLTSAIACALTAAMLAVFAKKDDWKWVSSPLCILGFGILLAGFPLLSFGVWSDIFPLAAGIFAVVANSRSDERTLRIYSLFWCLSWLLNSAFKVYPVAFANDLLSTVSAAVALRRYRKK